MFFKDLPKKDMKHLKEMGAPTLWQFKVLAEKQAEMRAEEPRIEPCWHCFDIAKKLGIPVTKP